MSGDLPELPFAVHQYLAGPHKNFHYILADPAASEVAVVDPAFELDMLFSAAQKNGYTITRALFTHGHLDHIGGVPEIFERGVQEMVIHESARDHEKVQAAETAGGRVRLVEDGDILYVGGVPVAALHTPGHQPESTCFVAGEPDGPRVLFGGDCLFIDSCGRTDFPGGDTEAMFQSMARLRDLDGTVTVLPGHDYAAHPHRSLADQRKENPALATDDPERFAALPFLRG